MLVGCIRLTKQNRGPDYPSGYPEFSAFVSEPEYQDFRRFKVLRMRMLLCKQDEIAQLESSLNQADREEERRLWLGNQRRDNNPKRRAIFEKLDDAFESYGTSSTRCFLQ